MMTGRTRTMAAAILVAGMIVGGCVSASGGSPGNQTGPIARPASTQAPGAVSVVAGPTVSPLPQAPAVDSSIAAVSLSNPPDAAARAFDLCLVREYLNEKGGGVISGLGHIESASAAGRYARLTGREPELKTAAGAWIVQFDGDIRMPMTDTIYVNPTCIVVDGGDGGFFATGGVRQVGEKTIRPPSVDSSTPDLALPAPKS